MPGRFDEQPAGVPGAGLGDRALAARLAGAVLGRDEPEVAHQRARRARSAASRRSRRTARPPTACRCRAGSATGRPCSAHGEPGISSPIAASRACRGGRSARRSRRDSRSSVTCAPRSPRSTAPSHRRWCVVHAAAVAVEAHVVAQQQLAHAVARAHQIAADVLARADEVAQRLLLACAGTRTACSPSIISSRSSRSASRWSVFTRSLRGPLDLARRRDHAPHAGAPAAPAPARTRSAPPHRPPASGPGSPAQNATTSLVVPDSRRERSSPDSPSTSPRPPSPRHARPDQPSCEPWPWSAPPMRLWAPRGVPPARLNTPTIAWGDRP